MSVPSVTEVATLRGRALMLSEIAHFLSEALGSGASGEMTIQDLGRYIDQQREEFDAQLQQWMDEMGTSVNQAKGGMKL